MRRTDPTLVLTVASLKMWFRDRQAIFWTFFLPLVLMVILGVLNFGDLGAVDLGVVDEAHNKVSRELAANLEEIESFDLFKNSNKDQEIQALSAGDRDLVLIVPPNFALSGGPVTVQMFLNAGQAREAQVGQAIVRQILDEMTFAATDVPGRFTIDAQPVDSQNPRFIDFLMPGIIAMSIMQMGLFSVAFSFVQLKNRGVLRRLLATPVHPASFLFAQVFTRLTVSILQTLVLIGVAMAFFSVDIAGNMASILLLALLGGGVFVSLGFAVSGWAQSEEVAAPIANVIALPMMFLSGAFFPRSIMPGALESVTDFLPLTYLIDALRNVAIDGEALWTQGWNILGLAVWLAVTFLVAVRLFRWE
jgi:ABC-2 type transport system permease protein